MSSSDSEDDSFLNIAQKLSAMKNDFQADTECKLNDSISLDCTPTSPTKATKNKKGKNKSPSKAKRKKSTDSCSSDSMDLETFRSTFPPIHVTAVTEKPKRKTRSAAKRKNPLNSPNLADIQTSLPKRRSRKSTATTIDSTIDAVIAGMSNEDAPVVNTPSPPTRRGRGRGRARGRGRTPNTNNWRRRSNNRTILDVLQAMIPIYSVGNTDEYPDQCDNQQLFSKKPADDVIEIEDLNETLEENELMSVKVEWMSAKIYKFEIRKYQKLTTIFEHFSTQQKVDQDKLYFSYQSKILKPDDTPDSIDYSIAKFIEGGIVSQSVNHLTSKNSNEDKDGVKLKFQCQNVKKPFEIFIKPDDKMACAMLRCAEHFEKPLDKLRFEFDGDTITGKSTPKELDLEEGGCIDVKILS